jgi:hypothetical protein
MNRLFSQKTFKDNHMLRVGAPFITFMLLGAYGLSFVVDTKVRRSDKGKEVKPTTHGDKYKVEKKPFNLEEELEVRETVHTYFVCSISSPRSEMSLFDHRK